MASSAVITTPLKQAIPVQFTQTMVMGLAVLVGLIAWWRWRENAATAPPDLPWVARREGVWILRDWRTRMWCWWNYEEALRRAYNEFARHSKPCVLATLDSEVVLLPPSSTSWLVSQPDTILSVSEARKRILQTKYTFPRPEVVDRPVHCDILDSELTSKTSTVTQEVCDELNAAVDRIWGPDPEDEDEEQERVGKGGWKTVVLLDSMTSIVARVSNRVFVGLPLCRDETYLKNATGFAENVTFSAAILSLIPAGIRALVAPLATYSNRKHARQFTRILTSEILRRQSQASYGGNNATSEGKREDSKDDLLQWLLTRTQTSSHSTPDETDPEVLCARLLHTNFASIPTTSFIATNALLDILASPRQERVQEILRREAVDTVDQGRDGDGPETMWQRTSLSEMRCLDSAVRESSRRAGILGVGLTRVVTAPGGVTTPEGWHIPKGCMVGTHSWGIHHDADLYPDAAKYKTFRFVETADATRNIGHAKREDADENDQDNERQNDKTNPDGLPPRLSLPTTSPSDLEFGHGPHACPGGFFAAEELKLLLAYVLSKYEIQMVMEGGVGGNWNGRGVRPECYWVGPVRCPPAGAKVRVRRRKE
ncbi:hypothetical protein PV04_05764 [Phialophora macrospora]|uniref:Cytochrome P450 n=1 Tax=Phialophora macrospora TaxID=1851006 RepID=A0A0D2G2V7_9EURO|nr:hypothetical protein PV04_05764 [Phialophora macrospora]